MLNAMLDVLYCPACRGDLKLDIFAGDQHRVAEKLTYEGMRGVFRDMDDGSTPEERAFSAISIVGRRPL